MALLDILDTTMEELIQPVTASGAAGAGVGTLRPTRARITGNDG